MMDLQQRFSHYLQQLRVILLKVPEPLFDSSLAPDMFPLATHAKIAANFSLRGYCPLIGCEQVSFIRPEQTRAAVLQQIDDSLQYLAKAKPVSQFDDSVMLSDKVGFKQLELCQSDFINVYIFPNFLFHISMVYAIARANGVALSKGDFDGLHSYPEGFSFIE
jgi:hypothetical protein